MMKMVRLPDPSDLSVGDEVRYGRDKGVVLRIEERRGKLMVLVRFHRGGCVETTADFFRKT